MQLYVLRGFQQITAVLNQQVQGVDDVGDVFEVGVFEGQAGEGLEQVRGSTDTLVGGGLDVFGVGFGVDEEWVGVGEVCAQEAIAFRREIRLCHCRVPVQIQRIRQRIGTLVSAVFGWPNPAADFGSDGTNLRSEFVLGQ
ncbi:hypothetical protein BOP93_01285 [Pseudomonas orientalis]|uniref:Uncharacterized protein n=1 Tax=Pseudomonas orientalis TaxID=76758 RepID=A0A2L0RQ67_9PSED|nr:hypothetical protein BOP93_01285 [Pseudomonas orientalis]